MKKVIKNITISSLIALVFYFALYLLWALIAAFITSDILKSLVIALVTSIIFCFCLLYVTKIRPQNDKEIIDDYNGASYAGILNDAKFVWKRESYYIYAILIICAICFVLTAINGLIFERAVISFPTLIFFPMVAINALFKVKIIGYTVSAIVICATYFFIVLLYRRRQYMNWNR